MSVGLVGALGWVGWGVAGWARGMFYGGSMSTNQDPN